MNGRVSPSLALAAYAEAWISGAKVVVFGDASSPLAERLVERGARHVQVYDMDAARAAEAAAASTLKQIAYASLDLAGSALRDGFFDVGIVEDLAYARQNPKDLLAPLSRALSRRGLALIGSRNSDVSERLIAPAVESTQALGYYDFYETVSAHFEEVRMLGQTPFVGYAIADFSATDASDVRIDTALLPGGAEEPEWFLALASSLPVSPDAFTVIQLPLGDLELGTSTAPAESGTATTAHAEALQAEALKLEAKLRDLSAALDKVVSERARDAERFAAERARDAERHAAERARDADKFAADRARDAEKFAADRARDAAERNREGEKQAAERSREAEKHAQDRSRDLEKRDLEKQLTLKLQRLETELTKRDEWVKALESRASTADQRADDAQGEIDRLGRELRKSKVDLARLEAQVEDERRSRQKLDDGARGQKQDLEQRERRAQQELQRLQADVQRAQAELQRAQSELQKAQGDAQRAQADAQRAHADAQRAQVEAKNAQVEAKNAQVEAKNAQVEAQRALSESHRVQADSQRSNELSSKVENLNARIDQLTGKNDSLNGRVEQLTSALAASEKQSKQLEERARQLDAKAKQLEDGGDEETRAELLGLEGMLKERAAEVARLTAALHETERFGRQLIVELNELRAARDAAREENPDVPALARQNAQLAADLEAARWTISSLEANVALDPTNTAGLVGQRRDDAPVEPRSLPGAD